MSFGYYHRYDHRYANLTRRFAPQSLRLPSSQTELKNGFKENKEAQKKRPTQTMPRPDPDSVLGKKKPTPSASAPVVGISLAPIPDFKLESRSFSFVRLGFNPDESETACKKAKYPPPGTPPERDDAALVHLIDALASAPPWSTPSAADAEFAEMERDDEKEALTAIFEARVNTISPNRYIIDVQLASPLAPPGNSDLCKLHVLLPAGYPTLCAARLLFTNNTLPPTLLRKVNKTLNKLALDELGSPIIFNVIEQLSTSLADFQQHFQNSQRKKELEAAQLREKSQKKVSAEAIKTITEAQYD